MFKRMSMPPSYTFIQYVVVVSNVSKALIGTDITKDASQAVVGVEIILACLVQSRAVVSKTPFHQPHTVMFLSYQLS